MPNLGSSKYHILRLHSATSPPVKLLLSSKLSQSFNIRKLDGLNITVNRHGRQSSYIFCSMYYVSEIVGYPLDSGSKTYQQDSTKVVIKRNEVEGNGTKQLFLYG